MTASDRNSRRHFYSLHIRKAPDSELALCIPCWSRGSKTAVHKSSLKVIPADACILIIKGFWNDTFKRTGRALPWTEKRHHQPDRSNPRPYGAIQHRPFMTRQKGSYSIKRVLPAFVDGLAYDGMAIADWGAAMEAYHRCAPSRMMNLPWSSCEVDMLHAGWYAGYGRLLNVLWT